MTPKQFKSKLKALKIKVIQESKDLDLNTWEDSLCIVRTGSDSTQTQHYGTEGTLNQAAWIGENSAVLLAEIHKLRSQRTILSTLVYRGITNLTDNKDKKWWAIWKRDAERDLNHCTKGI